MVFERNSFRYRIGLVSFSDGNSDGTPSLPVNGVFSVHAVA